MKRIFFIIILSTICGMTALAQDRPDMINQSTGGNHDGVVYFYINRPSVDYNSTTHELTIIGDGSSAFYLVEITNAASDLLVFSTVIDGTFDVIDANPYLFGVYNIRLTDDNGHPFLYTFDGAIHAIGNGFKPNTSGGIFNIDRYQLK